MNISIRTEQEQDYRIVEALTRAAFSYPERIARGGIGCPYEHWMVHALRKRDGILGLSLVAEIDAIGLQDSQNNSGSQIAGHIICSNAEVQTPDGAIPVLNFAFKRIACISGTGHWKSTYKAYDLQSIQSRIWGNLIFWQAGILSPVRF